MEDVSKIPRTPSAGAHAGPTVRTRAGIGAVRLDRDERVCERLDALQIAVSRLLESNLRLVSPVHTVSEAAVLLACSRSRVFELLREGRLEPAPKHGKRRLITRSSILRLLESRAQALPVTKALRPRANATLGNQLRATTHAVPGLYVAPGRRAAPDLPDAQDAGEAGSSAE